MPSCAVKSCKNYTSKFTKTQGITYHAFPRNSSRKDDWVRIIRICRGENEWNPSSASTVCSTHFDEDDFKMTEKGLRCLSPYAVPKKFLSNSQEFQLQNTSSYVLQTSSNFKGVANDEQPSSSPSTISSRLNVAKEKLDLSKYCRLCAASDYNNKLLNLQSDNNLKSLVVKMLNRLNADIDFNQEHLPATICLVCAKTLYTAYDFVVGIQPAQITLNNLSEAAAKQTNKHQTQENVNPGNELSLSSATSQQVLVKIEDTTSDFEQPSSFAPSVTIPIPPVSLKIEDITSDFEPSLSFDPNIPAPLVSPEIETTTINFQQSLSFVPSMTTPLPPPPVSSNVESLTSNSKQPAFVESSSFVPHFLETANLKDKINKKIKLIDGQKKKIKILNQKVRRLNSRNKSLKNILKNLKKKKYTNN